MHLAKRSIVEKDMAVRTEFREPTSEESMAGHYTFKASKSPYMRYVESEGIPIVKGIGVYDTRDVELGDWARYGARGAFLYLDGIGAQKGMHLIEVPGRGPLRLSVTSSTSSTL